MGDGQNHGRQAATGSRSASPNQTLSSDREAWWPGVATEWSERQLGERGIGGDGGEAGEAWHRGDTERASRKRVLRATEVCGGYCKRGATLHFVCPSVAHYCCIMTVDNDLQGTHLCSRQK
uniref:Uncharacterized protein n=1 Tax=Hemiselmis andersenii TaxID=464988 RepID=A0A6U4MFD2_HEMAN|mmetsp:Transcript_29687/g.71539  ORF Transcript_29687/g.71539 Transcript_29687/m.71539 type:complete len:121 (-) Transcript_29687:961-1323(-)